MVATKKWKKLKQNKQTNKTCHMNSLNASQGSTNKDLKILSGPTSEGPHHLYYQDSHIWNIKRQDFIQTTTDSDIATSLHGIMCIHKHIIDLEQSWFYDCRDESASETWEVGVLLLERWVEGIWINSAMFAMLTFCII
jgi:hypothetical protein